MSMPNIIISSSSITREIIGYCTLSQSNRPLEWERVFLALIWRILSCQSEPNPLSPLLYYPIVAQKQTRTRRGKSR